MKFVRTFTCLLLGVATHSVQSVVNFQPEELRAVNGVLDVTLTVSLVRSLNGTRLSALYNGGPIGPTLRVKPGDTLIVTLVNDLPESPPKERELMEYCHNPENEKTPEGFVNVSIIYNRLDVNGNLYNPVYGFWGTSFQNIHWHGAGFPPHVEDLRHAIDGGGTTKKFNYTIPLDHPPGLTWYHSHVHGMAAHGVMSGTNGFMVIEGTPNDVTSIPEIGEAREIFMMMSESLFNNETGLVSPFMPFAMVFNWSSVVNGILGSQNFYEVKVNETVLFRAVSAAVEPTIRLAWKNATGPDFWVVSEDGFPVNELKASEDGIVDVPCGSRVEFMALFDTPGTYELRRLPWHIGFSGVEKCNSTFGVAKNRCVSFDRDMPIATITVLPDAMQPAMELPTTLPENSLIFEAWEKRPINKTRVITFDQALQYPIFQIPYDGPFEPPGIGFGVDKLLVTPNHYHGNVTVNTCEEWTIVSDPPGLEHSIHSHTIPFLVTHDDGVPVDKPYWRDTHAIMGANTTIKICFAGSRFKQGDYVLLHCHMPSHMDIGMAAYFYVYGENYNFSGPLNREQNPPEASPVDDDSSAGFPMLDFVVNVFVLVLSFFLF